MGDRSTALREVKAGLSELTGVQGKMEDFVEAAKRMEVLFARLDGIERLDEVLDAALTLKDAEDVLARANECLGELGRELRRQRWVSLHLLHHSFVHPEDVIDLDRLAKVEERLRSEFDLAEADAK
jgi:hypothetical protein